MLFGLLCLASLCCGSNKPGEVLLVIACPPHPQQAKSECTTLSHNVLEQQRALELAEIFPEDIVLKVHVMHELFNSWTMLDALPHLRAQARVLGARTEWIIWCQHNTRVSSLRGLLEQLRRQNPREVSLSLEATTVSCILVPTPASFLWARPLRCGGHHHPPLLELQGSPAVSISHAQCRSRFHWCSVAKVSPF